MKLPSQPDPTDPFAPTDPVALPPHIKIPGEPIPNDRLVFQYVFIDGEWQFDRGSYITSEDRAWESDYSDLPCDYILIGNKLHRAYLTSSKTAQVVAEP